MSARCEIGCRRSGRTDVGTVVLSATESSLRLVDCLHANRSLWTRSALYWWWVQSLPLSSVILRVLLNERCWLMRWSLACKSRGCQRAGGGVWGGQLRRRMSAMVRSEMIRETYPLAEHLGSLLSVQGDLPVEEEGCSCQEGVGDPAELSELMGVA